MLKPTPDGGGVTVTGPAGQGLWVELLVVGAMAKWQNSLNVQLYDAPGDTTPTAVGALGSTPLDAIEDGVLGGRRYVFLQVGQELRFTQSTREFAPPLQDPDLEITGTDSPPDYINLALDDGGAGSDLEDTPDGDRDDLEIRIRSLDFTPDADFLMGLPQLQAADGILNLFTLAPDEGVRIELESFSSLANTLSFVKLDIDLLTGEVSIDGVAPDAGAAFRQAAADNVVGFSATLGGEGDTISEMWKPAEAGLYALVLTTGNGDILTVGPSAAEDGLQHIKVLGQNSFAFEDLLTSQPGSDLDYNDLIANFSVESMA